MHLFVLRPQRNLKIKTVFPAISTIDKICNIAASIPTKQMTF